MPEPRIYTKAEILAELRREYDQRKRLYPQWIERGTLNSFTAATRLAILEQAMEPFREPEPPTLFDKHPLKEAARRGFGDQG